MLESENHYSRRRYRSSADNYPRSTGLRNHFEDSHIRPWLSKHYSKNKGALKKFLRLPEIYSIFQSLPKVTSDPAYDFYIEFLHACAKKNFKATVGIYRYFIDVGDPSQDKKFLEFVSSFNKNKGEL
jgi:hypothetical protein